MSIETVRCARLWLESIEDQVFADVSREVQTSKSDLTARGVAFDLLQMAKRIVPQLPPLAEGEVKTAGGAKPMLRQPGCQLRPAACLQGLLARLARQCGGLLARAALRPAIWLERRPARRLARS